MNELTLASLLTHLELALDEYLPLQIVDPTHPEAGAHPEVGGVINPGMGMTDPWQAEKLIKLVGYHALISGQVNEAWFAQAILATDHLLQVQRPGGLIDLRAVNIDSSPDTGFTVQALCALLDLARPVLDTHALWQTLFAKIEQFVRCAVPGLLTGGFHTPNHRWVITSALVYAHALFPDLEVATTVESYLAETFDIDADGTFIERSIGVYDAVNCRALLLIAEFWNRPDALAAVARNLDFNLHMLHADGTAVTNLSRRQDYGTRTVPAGLIPCYLLLNRQQPNPILTAAANHLWRQISQANGFRHLDLGHVDWICYAILKGGEPGAGQVGLPNNFARYYPVNGMWRVRRGPLSASFFRDKTGLMSLVYGRAELSSVKISFTYFGRECGWFVGDELTVMEEAIGTEPVEVACPEPVELAVLHSTGLNHPRRPAYELPLGRPVPPEKWDEMMPERGLRHLPPLAGNLTVTEVDGGFDLHLQTTDGLDNVAGQIAFDFAPGGVWETADTRLKPQAGQAIFLKRGTGEMRYGNDVIQLLPGHGAHGFWDMRAAEPAPDHVRVLLTFFTPVDHRVELRVYRGLIKHGTLRAATKNKVHR